MAAQNSKAKQDRVWERNAGADKVLEFAFIAWVVFAAGPSLADTTSNVKQDPARPLQLNQPPDSYAAGEKGRCVVRTHVSATGDLTQSVLVSSTGFSRLDDFCAHVLDGQRMIPASVNGVPMERDIDIPLVFVGHPGLAPASDEPQAQKQPTNIDARHDDQIPEQGSFGIYAVYSCVHFNKNMPTPDADSTSCSSAKVFFRVTECKKEVPAKNGGVISGNQYSRAWIECREKQQKSWITADDDDGVIRLYKAEARVSDNGAMTALLAPLEPAARNMIQAKDPFHGSFQDHGNLSFFLRGDGDKVIAFAVSNLNSSQYVNLATANSFIKGTEDNMDFEIAGERAGLRFSYHTEVTGAGAKARVAEQKTTNVYQTMSVIDFVVNGPDLAAKGARVHLSGYYTIYGDVPVLFTDAQAANLTMYAAPGAGRPPIVPLLIDHASPELRRRFVNCDSHPGTADCYSIDISGVATMCTVRNAFGVTRSAPCVDAQHF